MESFKLWLEASDIQYLGASKYAGQVSVKFATNGKQYEYSVGPEFLDKGTPTGRKFQSFIKYAPGRAFNYAKKHGTYLEPRPALEPPERKPTQRPTELPNDKWPEDWELESRKHQARMQGNKIPF